MEIPHQLTKNLTFRLDFFFQLSSFSLVAPAIQAKKGIPIFMVEYSAYISSELADTSTLLGSRHELTCQLPLYYPTQRAQVEKKCLERIQIHQTFNAQ